MGKRRFRARLAWNLPDNLTFKGEPRTRKQQLELTKEKALDMMFNSGSDIPIIVRHGKEGFNRHGTATTYMDPDGSWWVVLTMDDSLKGTADVIQRVVAGELKEVSLGHDPETNRAMEVSLVLKGARQNTHIVREDDENEPANPLDAEELEVETSVISSHNGEKDLGDREYNSSSGGQTQLQSGLVLASAELFDLEELPEHRPPHMSANYLRKQFDNPPEEKPAWKNGQDAKTKSGSRSSSSKGATGIGAGSKTGSASRPATTEKKNRGSQGVSSSGSSSSSSSSSGRSHGREQDAMTDVDTEETTGDTKQSSTKKVPKKRGSLKGVNADPQQLLAGNLEAETRRDIARLDQQLKDLETQRKQYKASLGKSKNKGGEEEEGEGEEEQTDAQGSNRGAKRLRTQKSGDEDGDDDMEGGKAERKNYASSKARKEEKLAADNSADTMSDEEGAEAGERQGRAKSDWAASEKEREREETEAGERLHEAIALLNFAPKIDKEQKASLVDTLQNFMQKHADLSRQLRDTMHELQDVTDERDSANKNFQQLLKKHQEKLHEKRKELIAAVKLLIDRDPSVKEEAIKLIQRLKQGGDANVIEEPLLMRAVVAGVAFESMDESEDQSAAPKEHSRFVNAGAEDGDDDDGEEGDRHRHSSSSSLSSLRANEANLKRLAALRAIQQQIRKNTQEARKLRQQVDARKGKADSRGKEARGSSSSSSTMHLDSDEEPEAAEEEDDRSRGRSRTRGTSRKREGSGGKRAKDPRVKDNRKPSRSHFSLSEDEQEGESSAGEESAADSDVDMEGGSRKSSGRRNDREARDRPKKKKASGRFGWGHASDSEEGGQFVLASEESDGKASSSRNPAKSFEDELFKQAMAMTTKVGDNANDTIYWGSVAPVGANATVPRLLPASRKRANDAN